MRYLTREPGAPEGVFGTIETVDESLTFVVGQIHRDLHGRSGEAPGWRVAEVKPSPRDGYDALVVFESAIQTDACPLE